MRIVRRLLWLIAIIVLAAMVCVVALFLLVTPERVQQHLQKAFAQNSLTLQMNELPTVKVLPTVEVHLPATTIKNSSDSTIAQFRTAHFDLKPWWLLLGRSHCQVLTLEGLSTQSMDSERLIETLRNYRTENTSFFKDVVIESLILKDADFRLVDSQYSIQLTNFSAYVANPAPQMHAPVSFSSQLRIKTDTKDLLLEGESSFTLDVNLASGALAFEQLHLRANGTYNGASTQWELDSPLMQFKDNAFYSKTALLNFFNAEKSQQLTLSTAELKVSPDQFEAPDLRITYRMGSGEDRFELDLRSPISFKQTGGLWQAEHLQGHVLLPRATSASPISGQADGCHDNQQINLTLFSRLNESPVNFQGQVVGYKHPNIEGELVIGRLRIKDLALLSSISNTPLSSEKPVVDTNSNTELPGTQKSEMESDQTMSDQTTSEPVTADGPNPVPAISEESIQAPNSPRYDFKLLDHFDFNGRVVIGELEIAKLKAQQLKAPISIQKGVLHLPSISALLYDGRVQADLTIQAPGQWNITADASNVSVESLVQSAGATQKIPGTMNIQAHFFGNGTDTNGMNGQIGFSTINTKLFGLNLQEALERVENFKPLQADPTAFTSVDQISGVVTIHDALAEISPLNVQFKGAPMSGVAELDIENETLKGELNGSLRGLKTKLYISGHWWQPVLSLNSEEIQAANQMTAPKPIEKPQQEPASRWDRIKEFLKKHL